MKSLKQLTFATSMKTTLLILAVAGGLYACSEPPSGGNVMRTDPVAVAKKTDTAIAPIKPADSATVPAIEQQLINAGLVNIQTIDPTIIVNLKYSTPDNFLATDVYGDLDKAYLQPDVAAKLQKAQAVLHKKYPYYSLIVYDAVRPRSIQRTMWDTIQVPAYERSKYVSNPQNGSLHNFGAAVDLSIIDEHGFVLDMGTPYDFFGEMAYPREEQRLLSEGKLSRRQLFNREILRNVMERAGFSPIGTEWWHFNSCPRNQAMLKYKIIE